MSITYISNINKKDLYINGHISKTMQRKLVRQGENALTVTLPARWLKEQQMEAGDVVEVAERDIGIFVSKSSGGLKRTTIALSGNSKSFLRTVLSSAYKAGYDEITLHFSSPPKIAEVNGIVNTFTGLEIISQTGNQIVIKSFLKPNEETENLILKMLQITLSLSEELAEKWNKADLENLRQLGGMNLRKLRDLCLRTIHANRYGGERTYDYYDFVTVLEKIAAEFLSIGELISKSRRLSRTLELFTIYAEIYHAYLKKDFNQSNIVWNKVQQKLKAVLERISKSKKNRIGKKEDPTLIANEYHLLQLELHLCSRLVGLSKV